MAALPCKGSVRYEKSTAIMLEVSVFLMGACVGCALYAMYKGIGSNSGSEFYGSDFLDIIKAGGKGVGNNSGSKYYSDMYIKEMGRVRWDSRKAG